MQIEQPNIIETAKQYMSTRVSTVFSKHRCVHSNMNDIAEFSLFASIHNRLSTKDHGKID